MTRRVVFQLGFAATVLVVAAVVVASVAHRSLDLFGAAALSVAVVLCFAVLGTLSDPSPIEHRVTPPLPAADAFARFRSFRERLRWVESDPERFEASVRPEIVAIVEERLAHRLGIDRHLDPARAKAAMSAGLWELLDEAAHRRFAPEELEALMEEVAAW